MHHDGVGLGQAQFFGGEAETLEILLARRQQRSAHALVLQAQGDDHIGVLDALFEGMAHTHAHLRHVGRHQRARAHHAHLGAAQRGQAMDVGARHARVQHVAHDGHGEVAEVFFVVPDGVEIQQPLRGVGMAPVARVDDVDVRRHMLGDQIGSTRLAVPHHKQVGRHGREVGDGVEQRLALAGRTAGDVEVEHVGRQALGRDLERGARARAVLEEQVENALATQQGHLLDLAVVHADEVGGGVEDVRDDVARQALDGKQVDQLAVVVELGVALVQHGHTSLTWNWKRPCSSRASASDCEGGSATRAAAKSACTGNSRPPRSTSTARRTLAGRP